MKNVQVLKFGGTSLRNELCMKVCAQKVMQHMKLGPVVVIVSATAGTTDRLVQEVVTARQNGIKLSKNAADMIITTGEHISAALFSGMLATHGVEAQPICAWQLPIATKNSVISNIKVDKLVSLLNAGVVPVITGFQGIEDDVITTLDRGGSDLSAVCISKYLRVSKCYIYTDVPGVYGINPKMSPAGHNPLISMINYEDSYKLAKNGAKVIHKDAIRVAHESNIRIAILSTFQEMSIEGVDESVNRGQVTDQEFTLICDTNQRQFGVSCMEEGEAISVYVLHNQLMDISDLLHLNIIEQTENDLRIFFDPDKKELVKGFSILNGSIRYVVMA